VRPVRVARVDPRRPVDGAGRELRALWARRLRRVGGRERVVIFNIPLLFHRDINFS
jgi:hypothetical protein